MSFNKSVENIKVDLSLRSIRETVVPKHLYEKKFMISLYFFFSIKNDFHKGDLLLAVGSIKFWHRKFCCKSVNKYYSRGM